MSVTGYGLAAYGSMISNKPRMDAYVEALRRTITPGCHVVDIGTGPGAFAVLACKFGAGSVVAIEPDPSIEIARQVAFDNGVADRITFVRALSTEWQPERRADVVVSDIRGILPLFETHIPTIVDMRKRILAPDGVQIPGVDRLYVSLVENPEKHRRNTACWLENDYGIDLGAGHPYVANSRVRLYHDTSDVLMAEPEHCLTLDYRTITEMRHKVGLTLRANRRGTAHGLLMWFDSELVPGVGFSNAPGKPELVYGQNFFPFTQPLDLDEGAEVGLHFSASFVDNDYIFVWNTDAVDRHGAVHKMRQSTLKGTFIDPGKLAVRAASYCPPASSDLRIDSWLLQRIDGRTDLATIGSELAAAFPDEFASERAAFDRAAQISARYAT